MESSCQFSLAATIDHEFHVSRRKCMHLNRTRTRTQTRTRREEKRREEKKRDSNSSIPESDATEEKITQSENLMAEKTVGDANVRTKVKDTIEQLLSEKNKGRNGDEESKEEILLLSKLLSQLDESEKDTTSKPNDSAVEITEFDSVISESSSETNECGSVGQSSRDSKIEEIVKEIKEVKRQNSLTHWLLSIMIILTATWQFSEVTFLLNVKDKISHPFRSVGNVLTDALTIGHAISLKGSERKEGTAVEHPSIPALQIPELPQIDLPILGHTGAEHTNSQ